MKAPEEPVLIDNAWYKTQCRAHENKWKDQCVGKSFTFRLITISFAKNYLKDIRKLHQFQYHVAQMNLTLAFTSAIHSLFSVHFQLLSNICSYMRGKTFLCHLHALTWKENGRRNDALIYMVTCIDVTNSFSFRAIVDDW